MSEKFLMECGCVSYTIRTSDKKWVCAIHNTDKIAKELPPLKGRKAKCGYCVAERGSDFSLAFFKYNSEGVKDKFYCGCHGWD